MYDDAIEEFIEKKYYQDNQTQTKMMEKYI